MWFANDKLLNEDISIALDAHEGSVESILAERQGQLSRWVNAWREDKLALEIIRGLKRDIRETEWLKKKTLARTPAMTSKA